jgi:hypothetical protein
MVVFCDVVRCSLVVWYKFTDVSEKLGASIIMEVMTSETSVNLYPTTHHIISKNSHLYLLLQRIFNATGKNEQTLDNY